MKNLDWNEIIEMIILFAVMFTINYFFKLVNTDFLITYCGGYLWCFISYKMYLK